MPFAGYKDFDDCVKQNSDKSDPQAYCGAIKHRVEKEQKMKAKEQYADRGEVKDDALKMKRQGKNTKVIEDFVYSHLKDPDDADWVMSFIESYTTIVEGYSVEQAEREKLTREALLRYRSARIKGLTHKEAMVLGVEVDDEGKVGDEKIATLVKPSADGKEGIFGNSTLDDLRAQDLAKTVGVKLTGNDKKDVQNILDALKKMPADKAKKVRKDFGLAESVGSIGKKPFSQLRNERRFGMVVLGAGGSPNQWVDGIADELIKADIVSVKNSRDVFDDAYFVDGNVKGSSGRKDLVVIFSRTAKPNVGKLAMWRLRFGDISWIDDFVDNYARDYKESFKVKQREHHMQVGDKVDIGGTTMIITEVEDDGYEVSYPDATPEGDEEGELKEKNPNGPSDKEVQDMATKLYHLPWDDLGTNEMNTIYKKLGYPELAESLKKLPGVKPHIQTVKGTANYVGTEIEDKNGRWNDNYATRDGFWVIHEGDKHHVYKENVKLDTDPSDVTKKAKVKSDDPKQQAILGDLDVSNERKSKADVGRTTMPSKESLKVNDKVETMAGPGKVIQVAGRNVLVTLDKNSDFPGQTFEYPTDKVQKI